jgi:hypothetical protein
MTNTENVAVTFDLGTFEGFNFRDQAAIDHDLSASEVVNWDHDEQGEAEFWPSGDNPGVALLFKDRNAVSASELLELDRVLTEIGDDSDQSFLLIYSALSRGAKLSSLTREGVEDEAPQIFTGSSFIDLRRDAAYELFELYYPEEYRVWEKSHCDGLIFDTDQFLDSPTFSVDEVQLGDLKALLVAPQ